MEYYFSVPVKGIKDFTVKANSLEEAIHIMCNEDIDGDWSDQDFDIDIHETFEEFLRSQYD